MARALLARSISDSHSTKQVLIKFFWLDRSVSYFRMIISSQKIIFKNQIFWIKQLSVNIKIMIWLDFETNAISNTKTKTYEKLSCTVAAVIYRMRMADQRKRKQSVSTNKKHIATVHYEIKQLLLLLLNYTLSNKIY